MLKWAVAGAMGLALGLGGAAPPAAAAGQVEARQATMKQVAQTMKEAARFTSAQTPFDTARVKALMGEVSANAKKLHGLYPPGADDPKSAADPKIWQNKPDFDKRLTEMAALASTTGKASDMAAFKPAFSTLGATCKSCHDVYRRKKVS